MTLLFLEVRPDLQTLGFEGRKRPRRPKGQLVHSRQNLRTEPTNLGSLKTPSEFLGKVPPGNHLRKEFECDMRTPLRIISPGSLSPVLEAAGSLWGELTGKVTSSTESSWETGLASFCGVRGQPSQQATWLSRGSWGPSHP